jgi:hypothetical protein
MPNISLKREQTLWVSLRLAWSVRLRKRDQSVSSPSTGAPALSRQLLIFLLVIGVSGCYLLDDQTRGFHRFYANIDGGMSVSQVEDLFRETYPSAQEDGWPVMAQNEGGLWFTLDPRAGRYNSEVIHVVFEGGVVVSKEHLPD